MPTYLKSIRRLLDQIILMVTLEVYLKSSPVRSLLEFNVVNLVNVLLTNVRRLCTSVRISSCSQARMRANCVDSNLAMVIGL